MLSKYTWRGKERKFLLFQSAVNIKQIWGGTQKPWNLFIKNCIFILTCLNFSHFHSTVHLMQHTYWDIFSTAQNRFWTRQFWCLLVLLPVFVSLLPHQQKFFLWTFFILGNKSRLGQDWVNREVRAWRLCHFGSKTAKQSVQCGQVCS